MLWYNGGFLLTRQRLFHVSGLILLLLSIVAIVSSVGNPVVGAGDRTLYNKVKENAGKGDKQAAVMLARLDRYLKEKGVPIPPPEVPVEQFDTVNDTHVRLEGHAPMYLKVYNSPKWESVAEIDAYVGKRKAALRLLAGKDPKRQIEVALSPKKHLDLPKMWQLKAAHSLDVDQVTLNWFAKDGTYRGAMGIGDPAGDGEQVVVNFDQAVESVEAQVQDLIANVAGEKRIRRGELIPKVVAVRGKARAEDAVRLDSDPAVTLVDPVTDLLDAEKARALDVTVVDVPQLLVEREQIAPARP
jgi:hypothetical protein